MIGPPQASGNTVAAVESVRAVSARSLSLSLDTHTEGIRFDRANVIAFTLICALYTALRAWRLTSYGLYGDETFSLSVALCDWPELFRQVVLDVVHPPLFYILLKLWITIGGESLIWLKLFCLLISVALIVPFYLLCRELKVKPVVMNLAFFLMAVNAFLIYYSQELRMYSLLLTLTLVSLWLFVKLFNSDNGAARIQVALFCVNLLLVYTQYYGWAIVGIEFLFLLLLKRERLFAFSIGIAALIVCFAPWSYVVVQSSIKKGGLGANLSWNHTPEIQHLAGYYAVLSGGVSYRYWGLGFFYQLLIMSYQLFALLFAIPVALWCWRVIRRKPMEHSVAFWFLLAVSFLPALAAFLVSLWLPQSVWGMRYVIICAPTFLLFLALSFVALSPARLRVFAICLLCGWCALSGFIQKDKRDRVAIEPLASQLMAARPANAAVTKIYTITGDENANVALTLQFYLQKLKEERLMVGYVKSYDQIRENRFWVVFMKYSPEDQQRIESALIPRGYKLGEPLTARAVTYEIVLLPFTRQQ